MGYSPWGVKESNTTEQLSTKGHTHAQMLLLFLSPLPLLSLSLSHTHTHTHTHHGNTLPIYNNTAAWT